MVNDYECALVYDIPGESNYFAIPQFRYSPGFKFPLALVNARSKRNAGGVGTIVALANSFAKSDNLEFFLEGIFGRELGFVSSPDVQNQEPIPYRYYCPEGFNFAGPKIAYRFMVSRAHRDWKQVINEEIFFSSTGYMPGGIAKDWRDAYFLHKLDETE